MRFKKVLAAVLAVSMIAGIAGCNSEEDSIEKIENIMDAYVEAVNDFDGEAILELTNWDEDSDDYENVDRLFDADNIAKCDGAEFAECVKAIASTVKIDYDSDDFVFKDKKTVSIKIEYELVNWETIYFDEMHRSYNDVFVAVKGSKDTMTLMGKLEFKLEGKEWKISKISKINDVMAFENLLPNIITEIVDPVVTEPTEVDPVQVEDNEDLKAVLALLDEHETAIKKAQQIYHKDFVNIEDINEDGTFDVMFVSADDPDDDYSSGTLYIYTYNVYAGEAVEMIALPDIVYMAEGGSFVVFKTPDEIVVSYCHGETSARKVDTFIYGYDFTLQRTLERVEHHDYDPENDVDNCTYEYYEIINGDYSGLNDETYMAYLKPYIGNAVELLGCDYLPVEDEIEYPVTFLPGLGFADYDLEYSAYYEYINT